MPTDSPDPPEIEAIMADAADDHAKFVAENNEIDRAWAAGTLDAWVQAKLKEFGGLEHGSDGKPDEPAA